MKNQVCKILFCLFFINFFATKLLAQGANELIQIQVISKMPLGKMANLKEALKLHLPMVKNLNERRISYSSFTFEAVYIGEIGYVKKSLETFVFDSLPVKEVLVNEKIITVNF